MPESYDFTHEGFSVFPVMGYLWECFESPAGTKKHASQ
jgi:hypothetical protein